MTWIISFDLKKITMKKIQLKKWAIAVSYSRSHLSILIRYLENNKKTEHSNKNILAIRILHRNSRMPIMILFYKVNVKNKLSMFISILQHN